MSTVTAIEKFRCKLALQNLKCAGITRDGEDRAGIGQILVPALGKASSTSLTFRLSAYRFESSVWRPPWSMLLDNRCIHGKTETGCWGDDLSSAAATVLNHRWVLPCQGASLHVGDDILHRLLVPQREWIAIVRRLTFQRQR